MMVEMVIIQVEVQMVIQQVEAEVLELWVVMVRVLTLVLVE
jgi:hypothetical protein